jgi:hypothetical protein
VKKLLLGDNAKNAAADDCADAPLGHRLVTETKKDPSFLS